MDCLNKVTSHKGLIDENKCQRCLYRRLSHEKCANSSANPTFHKFSSKYNIENTVLNIYLLFDVADD